MNEEGVIISVNGDTARVSAKRSSACESCESRGACMRIGDTSDTMEINAINTAGGKAGDTVLISMESSSVIKIAILVYMLPVIALFAGVFLGLEIGRIYNVNQELSASINGIIISGMTYLIVRIIGKRIGKDKRYMPQIIKIIQAC